MYNGHAPAEFELRRTAAYVHAADEHLPSLSVDETLAFAAECQEGHGAPAFDLPRELTRAKVCCAFAGCFIVLSLLG